MRKRGYFECELQLCGCVLSAYAVDCRRSHSLSRSLAHCLGLRARATNTTRRTFDSERKSEQEGQAEAGRLKLYHAGGRRWGTTGETGAHTNTAGQAGGGKAREGTKQWQEADGTLQEAPVRAP